MPIVQPGGLDGGDEELGAVGVRTGIGHGHDAGAGVFQGEVLILEFGAVDGLATSAVVVGEVATLAHEIRDDTVEGGALVAETLFTCTQGTEVLSRLWNDIGTELDNDAAHGLVIGRHIEKYFWETHFAEIP